MYGPNGFVQYQLALPSDQTEMVRRIVERLATSKVPNFVGVLKRFGPANPGLLSFPIEGWTLAVDLPVGPEQLPALLNELDQLVLEGRGRVYLAKDSRLARESVPLMYPKVEEFRRIARDVDPGGVMQSDLARRLGLTTR
jgi:decaprenylphospho-beta-D-ribofuranose 2-oxidase